MISFATAPFTSLDVAFDGDDVVVAYAGADDRVRFNAYDGAGRVRFERAYEGRPPIGATEVEVAVAVGTPGYALAYTLPWNEPEAGTGAEIYAVQLGRDGTVLGEIIGLSDLFGSRRDAVGSRRPLLGWDNDRVVATWHDSRLAVGAGGMVGFVKRLYFDRWDVAGTREGRRIAAPNGGFVSGVWSMYVGAEGRPNYVAWIDDETGGDEVFVASIEGAGAPVALVTFPTSSRPSGLSFFERGGSSWVAWEGDSPGEGELRTGAAPSAPGPRPLAATGYITGVDGAPVLQLALNDRSATTEMPLDPGPIEELRVEEIEMRVGRVRAAVSRRTSGGLSLELREWCPGQ